MSRAFVDDDASSADEAEAPALKIPIPPGSRNYLTPAGAEALSRELHELTASVVPRLRAELAASGASGRQPDREGSAELRARLREADRRAAYLETMAALAETVPVPPPEARDRVKFGASVRVRRADGGEAEYRIVGVDEADPDAGLIGWPSPVARALVGRRPGDTARVRLPDGEETLAVLSLRFDADPECP